MSQFLPSASRLTLPANQAAVKGGPSPTVWYSPDSVCQNRVGAAGSTDGSFRGSFATLRMFRVAKYSTTSHR
jgi:hypothetical protein